jgi:hypothetical protein
MEHKDLQKYNIYEANMENKDNWKHRSKNMTCDTCMYFSTKDATAEGVTAIIGRCRRHAPTMKGWPVMFTTDWCGDHKLDENKI